MEQIFKNFLQGTSCLMVMQVAPQRTLLSKFLFCTTKSGIVMGQLLLSTRFSPMSLEPWQCSSHFISNTARSGCHNCSPAELMVLVLDAEVTSLLLHAPCRAPFAWVRLEYRPYPRGSELRLQGERATWPFTEALAQRVEHHASIFSEQLLFLSSVLSILGMFRIYQLNIFHWHSLSEWITQWGIPCGFRQSQDSVLSCWDSGISESPLKKHSLFLYCVLLTKGQGMKEHFVHFWCLGTQINPMLCFREMVVFVKVCGWAGNFPIIVELLLNK